MNVGSGVVIFLIIWSLLAIAEDWVEKKWLR